MTTASDRYVLCRPRNGLNDTLCQIERCWLYAENTGRTLLVDASRSDFFPRLSTFFVPRTETPAVRFDPDPWQLSRLDALSCFPRHLRGGISTHRVQLPSTDGACGATNPQWFPTFDTRRPYREQVLVHERGGGGPKSCHFLERVVLAPAVREIVAERLAPLLRRYKAVHVRNTDIQTNFEGLFTRIAPRVEGHTLLVCSDDRQVIERARRFFTSSRVVTVSDIPDSQGAPLHHAPGADDAVRFTQAVNAVVDLLALGGADTVYYTTDSVYGANATRQRMPSGFSRLAAHLSRNKHVIDALLGRDTPCSPSLRWRSKTLYHRMRHRVVGMALRCRRCA